MESPPPKTPTKIRLHSLAPTRNLDNNDNQYRVYRDCLSDAFSDPEMKNIALSGNLGAGKSSILHSFDKQRNGCEERFLYISLMDFEDYEKKCNCMNVSKQPKVSATSSVTSPGPQEQPKEDSGNDGQSSDKTEKNKQDRKKDCRQETQKRVEYNLLCQILAHCAKSDLRNSSLRGIPEPSFSIPESLLIALLPVLIFVLIFRERFSSWGSLLLLKQASLTTIHLWLYPFLGLLLFGLFFYMIYNGKLTKLSFNSNHATAEIAFSDTQTSLDLYKFELVHA